MNQSAAQPTPATAGVAADTVERARALAAMTERLTEVLELETAVLKDMRVRDIADIQVEKSILVESYERQVRAAEADRAALGELRAELRQRIDRAGQRLHAAAQQNERALRAAKMVNERVLQAVVDAASEKAAIGRGYSADGQSYNRYANGVGAAPAALAYDRNL